MRNFIVKRFALDYMTKAWGLKFNFVRAATFIYPLMVLTGIQVTLVEEPNIYLTIILSTLLVISLFLGFVYFTMYPVKYYELNDPEQIVVYGLAQTSGQLSKVDEGFSINDKKFLEAFDLMENNLEKKFYKPWRVVFYPLISTLLAIGLVLIII